MSEAPTRSPLSWLGARRELRARRRIGTGRARVVQQVQLLGPQWRVVDYHPDDPDFLTIGPGGVFQVTVCDHGRARVQFAGDVVQINGRRPPYVEQARRDAEVISAELSRQAGRRIPVIPVLAFLGSGEVVYYGKPPAGCVVTTYKDLGRALDAHGLRLATTTIDKLTVLAQRVDPEQIARGLLAERSASRAGR